ncbi:MAG: S8 family serine peptidase [Oligoflexia bacterium]|nr:S8 family serine peptidase [Oligoflexia bacterium]
MKVRSLPSALILPVVMASIVGIGFSLRASAGEVLRLKSGVAAIEDASETFLMQALGTFEDRSDSARYFVVQFEGAVPSRAEAALAAQGLETLRYLPDDALVVRGSLQAAGLVKSSFEGVRAVAAYRSEWKISDEFRGNRGIFSDRTERLVVTAVDAAAVHGVVSRLQSVPGVTVRNSRTSDIIVDAPLSALDSMALIEGVEWIQRLPIFVTFDYPMAGELAQLLPLARIGADYEYTGHESGTKIMNFDAAWKRGFMGEGQIVAIGDTGLDTGKVASIHPDFAGGVIKGYAMGLGAQSWEDPMGHGTHVAGSVAGRGAVSSQIKGGAFESKLIIEGLWSAILDNLAPGSDFNKLMGTPYNDGARIHTNSWGSAANLGGYDTFASRVDEFMWNNPDMLVLFAAGNSGEDKNADGMIDENSVSSPGTAKNVLTVGASENLLLVGGIQRPHGQLRGGDKKWGVPPLKDDLLSNNPDGIAAFSSRGPTSDGRLKPEIVAPGTNIVSVKSRHPKAEKLWGEFLGGADYVYSGGTSMSTPLTAGAAAVAREYLIKELAISSPSAALVKAMLMHTAHDLFPGQYGIGAKQELPTRRPNVHEGYGRVDMDLLTSLGQETQAIDNRAGVATGEEQIVKVNVRRGLLRATLSYTDAPASPSAAKALVNDLDLKVVSPSGQVRQLNDRVNNSEMIELSGLSSGDYQIVVSGKNVPRGKNNKQAYALMISAE